MERYMTFAVKKTRISIDTLFAAAIVLLFVYDKSGSAQISLCAAFFHEFGHVLCLAAYKNPPAEISFTPFGMKITRICSTDMSYKKEAAQALAGPAANLLLALSLGALQPIIGTMRMPIIINVYMALFNLLPIEPLDGGNALYYLLCTKSGRINAEKITKITAACGLIPLAAGGVWLLAKSGYNFMLLLVTGYLAAYVFVSRKHS